jgi:hypothetical protein
MAAGDVNSRSIHSVGDLKMMSGTLEAANGTAVYVLGTSANAGARITQAFVQNMDDQEGAQVVINSNNGSADTAMGALYITSAASDIDTWNYFVFYKD